MDGVPICEALDRCDAKFAEAWYHWFFLAQPDRPERAIGADADAWYAGGRADGRREPRGVQACHPRPPPCERCWRTTERAWPSTSTTSGPIVTRGIKILCPTLFLWSSRDDMEALYGDPLAIWRGWGTSVSGQPIDSGHHMAEENPIALGEGATGFLLGS